MNRTLLYSLCAVTAISITATASRNASAGGQSGGLVRLQAATPGFRQVGHLNLSGKIMGGGIDIFDSTNLGVKLTSNDISFKNGNEDMAYRYAITPEKHEFYLGGSLAMTIGATGVLANSFSGNGASLTGLNASNVGTGLLADARLSSNIPRLNGSNTFTGNTGFGVAPNTNRINVAGNASISGSLSANSLTIGTTTRTYTVGPSSFTSTGTGSVDVSLKFLTNGTITTSSYASAPVHLPDGARITRMDVFVLDSHANENLTVKLFSESLTSETFDTISVVIPAFDSTSIQSASDTANTVVDNDANFYQLQVILPSTRNVELRAVKITYTIGAPLP